MKRSVPNKVLFWGLIGTTASAIVNTILGAALWAVAVGFVLNVNIIIAIHKALRWRP